MRENKVIWNWKWSRNSYKTVSISAISVFIDLPWDGIYSISTWMAWNRIENVSSYHRYKSCALPPKLKLPNRGGLSFKCCMAKSDVDASLRAKKWIILFSGSECVKLRLKRTWSLDVKYHVDPTIFPIVLCAVWPCPVRDEPSTDGCHSVDRNTDDFAKSRGLRIRHLWMSMIFLEYYKDHGLYQLLNAKEITCAMYPLSVIWVHSSRLDPIWPNFYGSTWNRDARVATIGRQIKCPPSITKMLIKIVQVPMDRTIYALVCQDGKYRTSNSDVDVLSRHLTVIPRAGDWTFSHILNSG